LIRRYHFIAIKFKNNWVDEIPKTNQDEIKSIYMCSSEMLKNFHRTFPPKNAEQELKVTLEFYSCFVHQNVIMVKLKTKNKITSKTLKAKIDERKLGMLL
jgi:hypothetical protein